MTARRSCLRKMSRPHRVQFRVYYEDTDAGGVVYYANYLKFAERARTEWLRTLGFDQSTLAEKEGILFAVRHVEADIRRPARLDDLLTVETEVAEMRGARFHVKQDIKRDKSVPVTVLVEVACINSNFKPVRIPQRMREIL